jgi:hypothetical protein
MCLPLEATAETVESPVDFPQWSHHSGVASAQLQSLDVLSSDAPSELVSFVIQSQGKYSISSPTTVPKMLALEVTFRLH